MGKAGSTNRKGTDSTGSISRTGSKKRVASIALAAALAFGQLQGVAFAAEPANGLPVNGLAVNDLPKIAADDIVILYTNDIHCGYTQTLGEEGEVTGIGYAGVADIKAKAGEISGHVTLVDAGDALQGDAIGTMSKGEYLVQIMNEVGYDIFVPGNHEFDYGMGRMLDLLGATPESGTTPESGATRDNGPVPDIGVKRLDAAVVSSNFYGLGENLTDPGDDETVFDPYTVVAYGETEVAYVGVTTPESFTKSTPAYFQNGQGEYIYGLNQGNEGQDLYDTVQDAVDEAAAAGADYVVAVGHLGIDEASAPWRSTDVIANTTGIDAFIDGHSHSTVESQTVKNAEGGDVVLTQTGTKLASVGCMTIGADGAITASLISGWTAEDAAVKSFVDGITAEFEGDLAKVVAKTDVDLTVNDPASDERLIRGAETNLGDLTADAYRFVLGNGQTGEGAAPADIGFVNGGGIRTNIAEGEITFGEIIAVHPFNNVGCVVEATGREVLDALEMASRMAGVGENGGFLQVSGLTYTIDASVESSVALDDYQNFVAVDGEYRVKNVMVGGEPLDPDKTYTVASHNYMLLDGGDGINMFRDNTVVVEPVLLDNQILITYIEEYLNGVVGEAYANPYGQRRINISGVPAASTSATGTADGTAAPASAPAAASSAATGTAASAPTVSFDNSVIEAAQIMRYSAGVYDAEGGVTEIVAFSPRADTAYAVNGKLGLITAIDMDALREDTFTNAGGVDYDIAALVEKEVSRFIYGDVTSVAVSPNGTRLAAAVQHEAHDENGRIIVFNIAAGGRLSYSATYETGVQPDMIVYADADTILTANEGEPRGSYDDTDPAGSVTVVKSGAAVTVGFDDFDEKRAELVSSGVILKKDANPSADFEPEYIAVADDTAYITLQEANAVAVLDIAGGAFTGVYSLGVQDHSAVPVDLDNGGEYNPKTFADTYGVRMPDGIAALEADGKTYIVTANEGDAREWGDADGTDFYLNEAEVTVSSTDGEVEAEDVRVLGAGADMEGMTNPTVELDGLPDFGADFYTFGSRSFSVFEDTGSGLELVFDSGDDFEKLTAEYIPGYFNASNDDNEKDSRSDNKGPEPETVTLGEIDGKTYAFVSLERPGGIMVYDISDPQEPEFAEYINSRDFENLFYEPGDDVEDNGPNGDGIGFDNSAEGLAFITAENSPTGTPLLLAAFEVSGDVAAYSLLAAAE